MASESEFDGSHGNFDLLGLGDDFLDLLQVSQSLDAFELPAEDLLFDIDQWVEEQSPLVFGEDYSLTHISSNQSLEVALAYSQARESRSEYDLCSSGSVSCSNSSSISIVPENMPSVTPLKNPEKRRFEDCLSEFPGTLPVDIATKRRKFSTEGRKKVGQVRKVGACILCKLMKTPVSHCDMLYWL